MAGDTRKLVRVCAYPIHVAWQVLTSFLRACWAATAFRMEGRSKHMELGTCKAWVIKDSRFDISIAIPQLSSTNCRPIFSVIYVVCCTFSTSIVMLRSVKTPRWSRLVVIAYCHMFGFAQRLENSLTSKVTRLATILTVKSYS